MGVQAARFADVAPNAPRLPYQLRIKGWRLAGAIVVAGIGVIGGLLGLLLVLAGLFAPHRPALVVSLTGLGLLALGMAAALRLWRLKDPEIELFPDRLVSSTLMGPRMIYRADIEGVGRVIRSRYGSYFDIVTRPGRGDSIRVDGGLRDDPVFADWLSGAPDPSVLAKDADRASVLADSRYGATEADRGKRLDLARRAVIIFSIACVGLALWIGFAATPPLIALGVAGACLAAAYALVAAFQGLVVVWRPRVGVRPTVLAGILPATALALRGLLKVHLLAAEPLLTAAAVAGVGAAVLFYQRASGSARRLQTSIAMGAFAALLVYGAGAYLDALSADRPDRSYVVAAQGKHESHGRSTTYYLDLDAWGDQPAKSVTVSSDLYNSVDAGQVVCIGHYPGDLRLAWFNIGACRTQPAQPTLPSPPPAG